MSVRDTAEELVKELNATAPYVSYVARFATFKGFVYDRKHIARCSSDALAHAGFYSTATPKIPNSAKCPFCLLELKFSENDDPWEMHKAQRPNCDYVMIGRPDDTTLSLRTIVTLAIRCATVVEYEKILKMFKYLENFNPRIDNALTRADATKEIVILRDSSLLLTTEHRLATFRFSVRGVKKPAPAILKRLARAGWCSSVANRSHMSVKCPFCFAAVVFSETDDFWGEHKRIAPNCDFVKLNKLKEKDWTTEEGLMLAVRIVVMQKYERQEGLLAEMEEDNEMEQLTAQLSRMMAKPKWFRRRSCF